MVEGRRLLPRALGQCARGGPGPGLPSEARQGQTQAGLQGQGLVHLPGWLQAVPLGDGPPGLGQHVRPVLERLPRGPGAQQHLADRLGPQLWALGPDGQHQIHALGRSRQRCRRRGRETAVSLALSEGKGAPPGPLGMIREKGPPSVTRELETGPWGHTGQEQGVWEGGDSGWRELQFLGPPQSPTKP